MGEEQIRLDVLEGLRKDARVVRLRAMKKGYWEDVMERGHQYHMKMIETKIEEITMEGEE